MTSGTEEQDRQPNLIRVLQVLSDPKCMQIFQSLIASHSIEPQKEEGMNPPSSNGIAQQLHLSRKQFYTSSNMLGKAGLVRRKKKFYEVTTFGRLVFKSLALVRRVVENYWQILAIEALHNSIPPERQKEIIRSMIEDEELQELVFSFNKIS
jgi:hypothetical protein